MANEVCSENFYNTMEAVNSGCENIVNYLFQNAPDFWKLLYYNKYNEPPYSQPELTDKQKANMIFRGNPNEVNGSVDKNILFQMELDEAFSVAIPQVRFFVGDVIFTDSYRGYCEIHTQIIVPNKQETFIAPYSRSASRSLAIAQELTKALNGTVIPNADFNYKLFMDKNARGGAGRNTGWFRQKQNKNYAGYWGVFSTLI